MTEAQIGAPPEKPPQEKPLRRNRDFQALWIGEFLASVAKESAEIAYPLLILAETGSATWAGAVGSVQLLTAGLMSIPGGSIADKFDRKLILMVTSAVRMVLLAVFGVLASLGHVSVPLVMGLAVLSSACLGVQQPAGLAAIKQLVPASQLTQATSQTQIRFFGATVVGPPIGGWFYGLGRGFPFLSAAVAFLASWVVFFFIRKPTQAPAQPESVAETAEKAEAAAPVAKSRPLDGFRFIIRQPILGRMIFWVMGSNMAFNHSGVFLALIATAHQRGAGDSTIGVTLAVAGAGGLTGALLSNFLLKRLRPVVVIMYATWVGPVAAVLLIVVPNAIPLGFLVALIFLRAGVFGALFMSYIGALVPDRLQGRVIGVVMFISLIAQPLGIFGVGAIFDNAGPTWVFATMAIVGTVFALPMLSKTIFRLRPPEELAVA
ncbi:MFS transporter [Amycolatopsis sp. FDAARGOS 1241]|uniref:MFS transporter n=1 Tax=Amycolatopsis sp. FDAARGOS 1241 TaxID=2778070 RepID=UPI001EF28613|nr:MFS transporter [Amycolatopsis sp. FDAARGOS 1241]